MKPINTNKIQGSHTGSLHANSGSREETKLLPETDGPCSEIGALINEMSQAHDWLLNGVFGIDTRSSGAGGEGVRKRCRCEPSRVLDSGPDWARKRSAADCHRNQSSLAAVA